MNAARPTKSAAGRSVSPRKDPRTVILDVIIGALGLLVVVLAYSFTSRMIFRPPVDPARSGSAAAGTIQLDVLNGSGLPGAGTSATAYLRARGFDVVEYRNYRNFDVRESLVIDRAGSRENAEKVAYALGIQKANVIQQINQDYYVDVTVLIGRDYPALKPSQ
ncbi:MAG TPA: LytR C-terminal domain-containing protein [Bacteroidota bacterium]|nr:LytR C-terminal domain-containing protein [Bacteroidota bacterium]